MGVIYRNSRTYRKYDRIGVYSHIHRYRCTYTHVCMYICLCCYTNTNTYTHTQPHIHRLIQIHVILSDAGFTSPAVSPGSDYMKFHPCRRLQVQPHGTSKCLKDQTNHQIRAFLKSQWLIIKGYFEPIMVYFGV